jgi:hypothetical protein
MEGRGMNAFVIELENRPGMLAGLTGAIAEKGINITGVAATTLMDAGAVAILTNDEAGTRSALESANLKFRELPIVSAAIEDRPGGLHEVAQRLADAGVNVEALLPTGMEGGRVMIAFAVDDVEAARGAIGAGAGISA